jgi:hypothetical protein
MMSEDEKHPKGKRRLDFEGETMGMPYCSKNTKIVHFYDNVNDYKCAQCGSGAPHRLLTKGE